MRGGGKGGAPLAGRVALVTGGARGIGAEIAATLAVDGATVAICDVALEPADPGLAAYECDVTSTDSVAATVAAVERDLGPVDVLVNNAGILAVERVVDTSDETWERVIDVNLGGTFRCTRAVLPGMLERRHGRVISLASITATKGEPRTAAYAASKGGVVGFTRTVAREVAARGVTVNAVLPGYTETEQTRETFQGETREWVERQIPIGRLGQPGDIAGIVAFLAGPRAAYLTGQLVAVDGGVS
jgi:NAD(P)-dependent dehydrogenase (short-subunit alcohol dehydrogenase family)